MNHDPRRYGGQEYAPQGYGRPEVPRAVTEVTQRLDGYPTSEAQQPSMRPAAPSPALQSQIEPSPHVSPAAASAAGGDPPVGDDGSQEATLSRAYRAHDVSFRTLRFRKPTGLELRKFGYPIRQVLNADGNRVESIEINTVIAAKYIVALSQPPIPPSALDQMEIEDADQCYGAISRFFLR